MLGDAKAASNWVMGEVLRELKEKRIDITDFNVSPEALPQRLARSCKKKRQPLVNLGNCRVILPNATQCKTIKWALLDLNQ